MTESVNIRMAQPDISEAEIESVLEVLRSGQLSLGPKQEEFEASFAKLTQTKHAIAVSSGTAGLHLALLAAGIGPGDAVVTTPFSFVASANSILYTGADPWFVDVDEETGNLDVSLVHEALQSSDSASRVKGVLPVHVFGEPVPMDRLMEVTGELPIIEDACEAIGATYAGKQVGTFGRAGVFAFYPNKQITTGEGGMLVTDDPAIADLCRSLRNQGRDVFDAWLSHSRLGYNYRMDELSAALGVVQLRRLDELLAKRAQVAAWYSQRLRELADLRLFPSRGADTTRSWFVFVVRLPADVDRDDVMRRLQDLSVPSRPYFSPIHLQNHFATRYGYKPGDFPVCEALARSCLALPFSGLMTEAEVEHVCERLSRVLESPAT